MAKRTAPDEPRPLLPGVRVPALPASARPLFLPGLVRQAAQAIPVDTQQRERARAAFRKWSDDLRAGVQHAQTEAQLEQDFTKVLLAGLGYTTSAAVATGTPWTMMPKWPVPGAGIVDVALGLFRRDEAGTLTGQPSVMVELKGAGTELDRKQSRALSPVQQAWDDLSTSDTARWAIVSNYVEVRLYSRQKSKNHVHRALLTDLDDPAAFDAFYAVFHSHSLLGTGTLVLNAARLLEETGTRQEKVSDELYQFYAEKRADLLHELRDKGVTDFDQAIHTAQCLLDRILFIAFAEDRQLLPDRRTLEGAADVKVPGLTRWRAFQRLFRALDAGDPRNRIPKYNGSLFKPDPILDDPGFVLEGDRWPQVFKTIGGYDFQNEVTVDVLGRIFERSISDIEEIKTQSLDQHEANLLERRRQGRRRAQGIFYTDAAIVEYLVAAALAPAWDRQQALLTDELGTGGELPDPPPAAFSRAMLAWLDRLTVYDPACGSGAFLTAAYDWFEERRCGLLGDLQRAEPAAPEWAGELEDWRARSAPLILRNNLFGVDLSPESVEIAQLSLWIRTARLGQPLTDLSANVLCGNSVVDDPTVDARAFVWRTRFPQVFAHGGFDAVVGNPPYVRQELLGPIKPYLERAFPKTYHGMADLYVYFYELGLRLLKPGGRLAFVVTNKWMKAGYGAPLRRLFGAEAWVESVVDFGHAKQFFKDADVFPCFLVARKPADEPQPETARVCAIPRELVRIDDLKVQIATQGVEVERDRFGEDAWLLEPKAVADLLTKFSENGIPLVDLAGVKPFYGIKTGLNEAFLIDTSTRDSLVGADARSAEIIKPYLRGQDIKRWSPEWAGLWMIFARKGIDVDAYPAVKQHLAGFRERLEPKPNDWAGGDWPGRKEGSYQWYEIQDPVDYWQQFDKPKLIYQDITWSPSFCLDSIGTLSNNTTYFLASSNLWVLAVLNSPAGWWFAWRKAQHGKDEALRYFNTFVEGFPIPPACDDQRAVCDAAVHCLIDVAKKNQDTVRHLLDWLRVQYEVVKPSERIQSPTELDSDAFVAEVQKLRGKKKTLTSAALRGLREEYARSIGPARQLAAEARGLERQISDLVSAAYGLTPAEVRLMWDTAPPRMPIARPASS